MKELIYFIVCFLQPIILPIPEAVTVMSGSSLIGPLKATILGFIGTTLGIITMFTLSKYASNKIRNKFADNSKIEKFNSYIQRNEIIILVFLFVLPILPDEIICIGAGLVRINTIKFITLATVSKLISSISLAYSVELFSIDINIIIIFVILAAIVNLIRKYKINFKRYFSTNFYMK